MLVQKLVEKQWEVVLLAEREQPAIKGITEACIALDYPVVSGNVSLYNETDGKAIQPTPAIGGVGLLKDLTQVIFSDQINIRQVNTISESDGIANMKLLIEVKGLAQLSRLLARLEQQPGIISARRVVQGN